MVNKSLYHKRKKMGLCVRCSSTNIDTSTLCEKCKLSKNKECRNRYNKRIEQNRCKYCGRANKTKSFQCEMCFYKKVSTRYFGSPDMWKDLKKKMESQNYTCAITGDKLFIGEYASVDHIIPKSRGGKDVMENIQWVTLLSNRMKNYQTMDELYATCEKILEFRDKNEF